MSRLVPYTAASVDCVDTSTLVCFFRISGLWLQDRTIRQLKEEAQHLSKLGVRHVMWGLDGFDPGLSLATLYSLRHCLGVFCLGVPSARRLLLVVLHAAVVNLHAQVLAWPSMLGCTSYLWWYNSV